MKEGIHPKYYDVAVTCACGNAFQTRSTTKDLRIEICSACHPFFTGRQKLIDTAGRVERFQKRYEATKAVAAEIESRRAAKREARRKAREQALAGGRRRPLISSQAKPVPKGKTKPRAVAKPGAEAQAKAAGSGKKSSGATAIPFEFEILLQILTMPGNMLSNPGEIELSIVTGGVE